MKIKLNNLSPLFIAGSFRVTFVIDLEGPKDLGCNSVKPLTLLSSADLIYSTVIEW